MTETEPRDRILKLYSLDWSYAAIAAQLDLSRNQVASIISRAQAAGLKPQRSKPQPANFKKQRPLAKASPAPIAPAPIAAAPAPAPAVALSTGHAGRSGARRAPTPIAVSAAIAAAPLLDGIGGRCRYPIGDPRAAGFHFCEADRQFGSAYCSKHYAICYTRTAKPAEPSPEETPYGRFAAR
ncbi:GcrA family cell cycle regulator [Hypericibacter sp.]|uniref:GcrA family cell cycle regulator n=1 Tax=Hypericibacter sp. TaxID=2705401 RepID=UPI003D6C85B4